MAYTYMWMKDGSVVSGQTSSTYSFSPLRLTNSGQYSCQVSLGSTNTISEAITITVMRELDTNFFRILSSKSLIPTISDILLAINIFAVYSS